MPAAAFEPNLLFDDYGNCGSVSNRLAAEIDYKRDGLARDSNRVINIKYLSPGSK